MFIVGISAAKSSQPSLSHHMEKYREYFECKYESLELTSIDEKLNYSVLEYINLTLIKADEQERTSSEEDQRLSGIVTLSEAFDVEESDPDQRRSWCG